jgi:hypothetical protein
MRALVEIGESAVPALVTTMAHTFECPVDGATRVVKAKEEYSPYGLILIDETADCREDRFFRPAQSALVLGLMGERAVPALLRAILDKRRATRVNAVAALNIVGTGAEEAVPRLIELLGDNDWLIRWTACASLVRINIDRGTGLYESQLIRMLDDPVCQVRMLSAKVLGAFACQPKITVPALIRLLRSTSDLVLRENVVYSFIPFGEKAASAGPAIIEALKLLPDSHSDDSHWYAETLAVLGPDAVPLLAMALSESDLKVRSAAAQALSKMGAIAIDALPDLIRAAQDEAFDGKRPEFISRPWIPPRTYVIQAIENIGPDANYALPILKHIQDNIMARNELMKLESPEVRIFEEPMEKALLSAIAKFEGKEAPAKSSSRH